MAITISFLMSLLSSWFYKEMSTEITQHVSYCQVHGAQRIEMLADDDKWLCYTDVSKQPKVPFVVNADFERILERQYCCQPDLKTSSTAKLARHVPSGFTYKVVGITPDHRKLRHLYPRPDVMDVFIKIIIEYNVLMN